MSGTSHSYVGKTAIAGIGATEFSKASGRSELRLAVEAVDLALRDAGIEPSEVDGLVTFSSDTNPEIEIARSLGMGELSFFSRIHYGGGAGCGTIQQAALAIEAGVADVVVCYRAFNERSGNRFGAGVQGRLPVPNAETAHFAWYAPQGLLTPAQWVAMAVRSGVADVVVCYRAFNERSGNRFGAGVQDRPPIPNAETANFAWYAPVGLLTPAQWVAMAAQRYLHVTGATSEDLGRVAVADRKHAATNPKAWFYEKPITLEEHQASRWIVEPLHLLDCCQETDGGQALVVTSLDRARDLQTTPAVIRAAAQGAGPGQEMMTSYYYDDLCGLGEMEAVARQLWQTSGLSPADIQTAVLYDHFTPYVLYQLEELGFCAKGEAKDFIRDGNIEIGGGLPINTHGGQLGEAYLHGMNGIAEGVRQVRGTSVNQVPEVNHVLVTAGTGVPTSGLILGVDR